MVLEVYRKILVVTTMILILIAIYPTLSLLLTITAPSREPFSEFSILGPNHVAKDYPFNVSVDEEYHVFVDVRNYLTGPAYYLVYVKLRNQSQPSPNLSNVAPSSLPSLYEFRFLLDRAGNYEIPLTFGFSGISHLNDSCVLSRMSINNITRPVEYRSVWDQRRSGFYYQLFFELWLYNEDSESFQFDNRVVGIWLNMTTC